MMGMLVSSLLYRLASIPQTTGDPAPSSKRHTIAKSINKVEDIKKLKEKHGDTFQFKS